jgi:hypothetical protein
MHTSGPLVFVSGTHSWGIKTEQFTKQQLMSREKDRQSFRLGIGEIEALA